MPSRRLSHPTSLAPRRFTAPLLATIAMTMCACSDGTSPPDTTDAGAGPDASLDALSGDVGTAVDSGSDATADEKTGDDARRDDVRTVDAQVDEGDADGSMCAPQAVWAATARGFTYRQSGGFVAPVPTGAGCVGPATNYDYVAAVQTLAEHSCTFAGKVDRTVVLSAAEATQLVTFLNALRTSCPVSGCGADYPDVTLEVRPASGAPTLYTSDFYAGCGGAQVHPPYVAYSRLGELSSLLHGFVAASCSADAGADASRCMNDAPPDGGRPDGAAE